MSNVDVSPERIEDIGFIVSGSKVSEDRFVATDDLREADEPGSESAECG
jgi:hypothetical protein